MLLAFHALPPPVLISVLSGNLLSVRDLTAYG